MPTQTSDLGSALFADVFGNAGSPQTTQAGQTNTPSATAAQPPNTLSASGPTLPPATGDAGPMSPAAEVTSAQAAQAAQHPQSDPGSALFNDAFHVTAPSGQKLTPGMLVTVDGHTGVVQGLHPETGKVVVEWGKDNTSDVSPGDLNADPNVLTSFVGGVGNSLVKTVQGLAKIIHAPQDAQNTLASDQQQLTDAKSANPFAGGAGSLAGEILQFMAGGEALKAGEGAIGIEDMMANSAKISKAVSKFPRLAKALQAGLRAGTVGGTQGTVQSGGDLGTGIETGLATGATAGLGSLVGDAIPAIYRKLYPAELPETVEDPQPVYDTLHQGLRDTLDKVAQDAGVEVKPADSIRDVVSNTAKAVRAKASGVYKQMDDALMSMSDTGEDLPGRFQQFDEDIKKLTDKIGDAIGDPEKQQQYSEALDQVQANKQLALQKIKDAGLPEDLPNRASALHKQSRALDDLSKAVLSSTNDGLRPEFAKPGSTPELLDPGKLSRNLNKLYDNTKYGGRRLVQAVGDGAQDLLTHADSAKAALERISQRAEEQAEQIAKIAAQRAKVQGLSWKIPAGVAGIGGTAATIRHFLPE